MVTKKTNQKDMQCMTVDFHNNIPEHYTDKMNTATIQLVVSICYNNHLDMLYKVLHPVYCKNLQDKEDIGHY
jgi:hypothetical protein